ncbi:MAG: mechanosensitive ion channel family protein [Methanomassiliicoccales archaeon]|nr:mechanosensitive ion channel family protein [Methanomassiliicoccales archaeon]
MFLDDPIVGSLTILDLIAFLIVLVLSVILAKGAYALIRRVLDVRITKKRSKMIAKFTQYLLIIVGLYIGFWEILKLDISAFLVSLGVIGIAVALASQQVIQNAFAGILISVTKPFEIEDWVEVGGMPATGLCRVKDVNLINTVMRDLDGRILYIPNSFLIGNKLINYTKGGFVALTVPVWISRDENVDRIARIVMDEADKNNFILPNVIGEEKSRINKLLELPRFKTLFEGKIDMNFFNPQVNVVEIQGTRTKLAIKIWIREINRKDEIISTFLKNLRERFEKEGVKLVDV